VTALPEAVGCWVEDYPVPQRPQIRTETINGVNYNVAELKKVAVFPSKSGKITITPLEMIVDVVVPRQRRQAPRNLFDDFFSDPFNQVVKKKIRSNTVQLTVNALPTIGQPKNFSGLVGDYTLNTSLDKDTLKTNEAMSFKIAIAGTGLLKFLNDLQLNFSPDFQVFEPKISESINKNGSQIRSSKEFEYVIIPRVAGNHTVGGAQITYFDPASKSYKNLLIPEYQITVLKGEDLAVGVGSGTVLSKEEIQLLGTDIRYIKQEITDLKKVGHLPFKTWLFYLSLIFPAIILGVALVYRSYLEKMSTNIEYARSRKAQKIAKSRLKQAQQFLKQQKAAEFYGAVSSGLIGYVADKFNKSAAGMVRQDLEKLLSGVEINPEIYERFFECLDEADFRRFAPGNASDQQMSEFYSKAEKLLISLEKSF
jgi:hypothetical protein